MVETKNLTLGYGESLIVESIELKIEQGDRVTIIGVNGSGKSTILKAMSRNLKPLKGAVYLDGYSILTQSTREIAKKLAMLSQTNNVPLDFTVKELVSYGRYPYLGWNSRMQAKDHMIVDWAISAAKIEDLQHRLVSTLSGGERQRAWIALALAQQPQVLLLDEPTTFLDISHQFEILELTKTLNEKFNITTIMVLHDINQAIRYSKKIVILKDKKVYKIGEPCTVITEQVIEEVFNIKVKILEDENHGCPYLIPLGSSFK